MINSPDILLLIISGIPSTFEASTAPIVYAKSEKDLTDNVIELYNKRHK